MLINPSFIQLYLEKLWLNAYEAYTIAGVRFPIYSTNVSILLDMSRTNLPTSKGYKASWSQGTVSNQQSIQCVLGF